MSDPRPVHEWPDLLCGPILRRATREEICVFVAFKQPASVQLRLFDAVGIELADADPITTLALGARLHVAVASYVASPPLLADQRYQYDLRIWIGGHTHNTLADFDNTLRIGYGADGRPGFRIAADLPHLHLLHASCRKPHGEGHDLLALVDDLIYNERDTTEHPHQLLLTGDQIYADDVDLGLAQLIAATAPLLLTFDPALQDPATGPGPDGYLGEMPDGPRADSDPQGRRMNAPDLEPGSGRRVFTLPDHAGLGVDHGAPGHLLYLGEFYAMYLLAWSEALWPAAAIGQHLDELRRTLPKVRRALANIPTYMIFDDHEVTDDWNLNQHWRDRVHGRAAGHQIVRNGLLAYAVFQDWGNRPAYYRTGQPGAALLETLRCPTTGPLGPVSGLPPILTRGGTDARRTADALLDLPLDPSPGVTMPARLDWHWSIAFDSHLLIALDTRTRRGFPNGPRGPAQIIEVAELDAQLTLPRLAHPGLQAILLAPGPIYDVPATEIAKLAAALIPDPATQVFLQTLPDEFLDRETWGGDHTALTAVTERLADFDRVVVLSGDVHYAFSNATRIWRDQGPAERRARVAQLCSSPARHQSSLQKFLSGGTAWTVPPVTYLLGSAAGVYQTLRTDLEAGAESVAALAIGGSDAAADAADRLWQTVLWLDSLPTQRYPRLPLEVWDTWPELGAAADALRDLLATTPTLPSPRLELRFQVSDLPDTHLFGLLTSAPELPPLLGSSAAGSDDPERARQLIGLNNLAAVRFDADPPTQVTHTLYWVKRGEEGHSEEIWYTRHRLALDPDDPG